LALFLVLYVLARYVNERRNPLADWRFLLGALAAGAIGVSWTWIAYQAAYGVSLGQVLNVMLPIHIGYEFNRLVWTVNHPYEFVVFLGLPLAGLLIVAFIRALKSLRAGQADALSLSFVIGLIILSLIDPARDETARTWLLLMPFAVIVASQMLVDPHAQPREFGALWGLLGVQLVVMTATLLIALMALFGRPPDTALTAVPADVPRTQADFGGVVHLIGSQIDSSTQPDRVSLDLYWQPAQPVHHPYVLFVHLVDAHDRLVAQQDARSQPLMTCWQPGAIYHDPRSFPIARDLPGGAYTLNVGLYNSETGARLPVTMPDGTESDHVTLGQVQINRP
jgi:hypothetical protein